MIALYSCGWWAAFDVYSCVINIQVFQNNILKSGEENVNYKLLTILPCVPSYLFSCMNTY